MIKIRKTSNGGGARGYAFIFEADDMIPTLAAKLSIYGVHKGPLGLRSVTLYTQKMTGVEGRRAIFAKDPSMSAARRAAAQIIRQSRVA
jgi:hypothetical protein